MSPKTFIIKYRHSFYCLSGTFGASVLVIWVLFIFSEDTIHSHNSFIRQFPPHTITPGDTLDLKFNSYYIAGGTSTKTYLGNLTSQLDLIILDNRSMKRENIVIHAENIDAMRFRLLMVKVDSPNFYLTDGTLPIIFRGPISTWMAKSISGYPAFFMDAEPMGSDDFGLRTVSSVTNEFTLGKEKPGKSNVKLAPTLLQKQIDGRFCVDGMLHFNKKLNTVVYLYYYRNQYIVADTGLNLMYRGKTIDTISKVKIKIATIQSKHSRTLGAPPVQVNKHSCVYGNFLFVNSALMAKNEEEETFDKVSVVDVYDLTDKTYRFSFYVPDYEGHKIMDMKVYGGKLVILFNRYLLTYNLVPQYFNFKK